MKVRDLMTSDVLAVSPDLQLWEFLGLLDEQHVTGAPVVAGRSVVGVISASDVLAFEAATPPVPKASPVQTEVEFEPEPEWEEGSEAPSAYFTEWWSNAGAEVTTRIAELRSTEWNPLQEHVVEEAMSRTIRSITPDADIAEAASRMVNDKIHRLLVMDDHNLEGILTTTDLVRAVASRRLVPA